MRLNLSRLLATAALASAFLAGFASAASAQYPDRPVTFVVPFAAGSSNDTRARIIGPRLSEILGQPVVVENMPGAAAMIGIEHVARANPDGYTLLFTAGAITLLPALRNSVRWDPIEDIAPISILGGSIFGIAVNADIPASTLPEFIAYAKERPGEINAAVSGNSSEIGTHLFQLRTDTEVEMVSYAGTGEAVTAVLSGEADMTILDSASFLPVLATGRIKVLAIANDQRISTYPDVPTAAEQGVDFATGSTFGVYAPGGTPDDVLDKLNLALTEAANTPEVNERLTGIGLTVRAMTREESNAYYLGELETFRNVVEQANIPRID
jgi:tripartite-type tricarboxylate transporter receptor subunit TctC